MSRTTNALPAGRRTRTLCALALAALASSTSATAAFAAVPTRGFELVTPAGSSPAEPVAVHPFKGGDGFGYRTVDGQMGALEGVWTGFNAERTADGWANTRLGAGVPVHHSHGATNARVPIATQQLGYSADGRTTWVVTMLPLVPEDENTELGDPAVGWGTGGSADIYAITDGQPVLVTRDAAGKAAGIGDAWATDPQARPQQLAVGANKLVFALDRQASSPEVIAESGPARFSVFVASANGDVELVESFATSVQNPLLGRVTSEDATRIVYRKVNTLTLWNNGTTTALGAVSQRYNLSGDGKFVAWVGQEAGDAAPRLRRYDVDAGTTTLLSAAYDAAAPTATVGLLATSDDGQTTFFSSQDRLTADTPGAANGAQPNHYVYTGGTLHFIARASVVQSPGTSGPEVARVTDGGSVFFPTSSSLLPADTDGASDLYRWSPAEGLTLLSQGAAGGNAETPISFGSLEKVAMGLGIDWWSMPSPNARWSEKISADGRWAFFSSNEKLTADAGDNGRTKVYGSHNGELVLISAPGDDARDARYINNNSSGRDVFFVTDQAIDPRDTDGLYLDVYDARIGGGFALPPTPVDPCPGNACGLPVTGTPGAAPATTTANGPGNPTPAGDPSNRFTVKGKPSTKKGKTSAKIKLVAPGEGRFSISAKAKLGKRTKTVLSRTVRSTKAGTRTVTLKLNAAGRSALKRARSGRLRLKIQVTFEPEGGFSRTRTVTVTFTTTSSKR